MFASVKCIIAYYHSYINVIPVPVYNYLGLNGLIKLSVHLSHATKLYNKHLLW